MAQALQCPACGHNHPLDRLAGTPTFTCEGCGRTLKTPEGVGSAPAAPVGGAPARPRLTASPVQPAGPRTAVLPTASPSPAPPADGAAPPVRTRHERRAAATGAPGAPPAWVPKLLLPAVGWVVALVGGGLLVYGVARSIGFISSSRLLDVFTGAGYARYVRPFVLVPVWALVSATIAQLVIEGGRVLLVRRARARAAPAETAPAARAPAPVPGADGRPASPPPAATPAPDEIPAPVSAEVPPPVRDAGAPAPPRESVGGAAAAEPVAPGSRRRRIAPRAPQG